MKGEAIPLGARIISISDAFDAIRSARPYKLSFNIQNSTELLRAQAELGAAERRAADARARQAAAVAALAKALGVGPAAARGLVLAPDETPVTLEGLAQLLSQPEFAQSHKLRPILEVLEQQPLLARFLAESLATPGVQVIIGAENRLEQMREASLVLTRYGSEEDAWGVLGVLGPTRLPYWRAVPMVRFMAELMDVVASRPGR